MDYDDTISAMTPFVRWLSGLGEVSDFDRLYEMYERTYGERALGRMELVYQLAKSF